MAGKLTPKQAIFAAEYLIDFNATRAATAAGFAAASAHVTGARLLRNAKVAAAIAARQQRIEEKLDITVERTARKLAEIGYGDIRELLDEEGNLLPVHRMSEGACALVAGLEVETNDGPGRVKIVVQKVKLADRIRALELLGRYQKMFTDRIEGGGPNGESEVRLVIDYAALGADVA
jgi:phage terminase small subunit